MRFGGHPRPAHACTPRSVGSFTFEVTGTFSCPRCGAELHDLTAEACSYCGAAFLQRSPHQWSRRLWHTSDGGVTWTIIARTCPGCGGAVTDAEASQCPGCRQPLPPLQPEPDPRPSTSIRIHFPRYRGPDGVLYAPTNTLVRYLDCRHWPATPPVPRAIATVLRPLPDCCPRCSAVDFDVVPDELRATWDVVCAECGARPGVRPDAD
jgi:hypothetical protein